MEKEFLIKSWMAEDLLGEMQHKDVEIIGEKYFDNLVVHSFFQEFEKDENDKSVISCKMHEIVHDFSQYLRRTKGLMVATSNAEELNMNSKEKARHLTLIHNEAAAIPAPVFDVKKLRSLHLILNDTSTVGASLAKLLDRMTCLRILSFKYMNCGYKGSIKRIPKKIGNLRHLGYLNLEGNTDLEKLPETVCGDEFLGTSCLSPSSSTNNKIAFPALKKLKFHSIKEWEKWMR
ncbi:hypothetical protein F3Y22_tig00109921pilonHSYRG00003 [Hibiscus syriacus]|uniref:Disease resistance protein winged helix domain-containing protein n=1 Tax=Hibiscus syriacus TaxID=106335 RepID=A0A6A3BYN4_HIBSY|nr:hypothetical protein F3Y22_tig00109921pilonHSYRG00003 [Hibiscus syriacus]